MNELAKKVRNFRMIRRAIIGLEVGLVAGLVAGADVRVRLPLGLAWLAATVYALTRLQRRSDRLGAELDQRAGPSLFARVVDRTGDTVRVAIDTLWGEVLEFDCPWDSAWETVEADRSQRAALHFRQTTGRGGYLRVTTAAQSVPHDELRREVVELMGQFGGRIVAVELVPAEEPTPSLT